MKNTCFRLILSEALPPHWLDVCRAVAVDFSDRDLIEQGSGFWIDRKPEMEL